MNTNLIQYANKSKSKFAPRLPVRKDLGEYPFGDEFIPLENCEVDPFNDDYTLEAQNYDN